MTPRRILGVDPDVPNGFNGVRVRYAIDADASRADIEAIVAQSQLSGSTLGGPVGFLPS